jgi:prepilin-type N-terminal cleavage/methylation domain-containing protein
MLSTARFIRSERGFTVIEILMVVAMIGILGAMAVPVMKDVTASIKLNEAARMVEREMQSARLKAVSANRVLRVRLNCPETGYIRTVEMLATAADTAGDRCTNVYPFPAPDTDVMTRPNYDGPVRTLPMGATVSSLVLQFAPDGTATDVIAGVATAITTPVAITVSRDGKSKTVTVNNVGKVQLQ